MSLTDLVEDIVARALGSLPGMVETITDLVFSDAQNAVGNDTGGDDVGVEVAGLYGFISRPLDGADGLIIRLANSATAYLLGYRVRTVEPKIEKGEWMLYDDQGQQIHMKRDGIYLVTGGSTVKILRETGALSAVLPDGANLKLKVTDSKITVESGSDIDITTTGGGNVNITTDGKVYIGDAAATSPISKGDVCKAWHDEIAAKYKDHTHDVDGAGFTAPAGTAAGPCSGTQTSKKPKAPNDTITDKGDCQADKGLVT